jgi:hypothetical protein
MPWCDNGLSAGSVAVASCHYGALALDRVLVRLPLSFAAPERL